MSKGGTSESPVMRRTCPMVRTGPVDRGSGTGYAIA
jgi:hypothetical protein